MRDRVERISNKALELIKQMPFDCLAYALVDFKSHRSEFFEIDPAEEKISWKPRLFFDLASLTKPLTLSSVYHKNPKLFSEEMVWLLNHSAGLPAWGRLSRSRWKEEILAFPLKKSKECYSDYSALRLMLELEQKSGKRLREICDFFWNKDLLYSGEVDRNMCPVTGTRKGQVIRGEIHDPNAYTIGEFCSHAGLFSTITGLAKSLIDLNKMTGLVSKIEKSFEGLRENKRFLYGWDISRSSKDSLAGENHGKKTFGHLGFTGTSIWIDSESQLGQVLLTNGCYPYERSRDQLNRLRRILGTLGWEQS